MTDQETDRQFSGPISEVYESYLVPLIFEKYAVDLANRVAAQFTGQEHARTLEIAAGTGAVTRALASTLPESVSIVATDLNQTMLNQAMLSGTSRRVEWRQADAMQLPFPNASFDTVVCQFGVMFFPDKAKAFAETRRVLRPGGVFVFNVWDCIEENEFAHAVTEAMGSLFPDNPAQFMARTPHGYFDQATIERDLRIGGFTGEVCAETLTARSRAVSARHVAIAFCQGTPLRNEIEARDATRLGEATDVAARAIAARFGTENVDAQMQARVFTVS